MNSDSLSGSLPEVLFMKLISCSLYNSWDTLKNKGTFSIFQPDKSLSVSKILPGHYTLEAMAKQLEESFKRYTYEISMCNQMVTSEIRE